MDYWKNKYLESLKFSRIFGGTMFFGIIINLLILTVSDNNSCDEFPCDPYIFYLAVSLIVGFIIAKILLKVDPPIKEDLDRSEKGSSTFI